MKLLAISLLLVLGALGVSSSAQNTTDVTYAAFSPAPYRVGERLTFRVSFSQFVTAGHIQMLVAARGTFFGREGVQLKGHVESTGVVNAALLAINNDYVTYVDPTNGLPYRGQQIVREATRSTDTSADYNQPAGTAAIPPRQLNESSGTYDYLSAIYRLRSLPLHEGSAYVLNVRGDNENYRLEVKVVGRQSIKTNVGSFNAIDCDVSVRTASGNRTRMRAFFSDDERHVPVLVTVKVSAGIVSVELAASEFVATPPVPPPPSATPAPPVAQPAQPSSSPPVTAPPSESAPPNDPEEASIEGLPFKVGEQLNYRVFLPTINPPVAAASFQVRARSKYFNRDGMLLTLSTQTTSALQALFVANDSISSYVDPKALLPFRTELALNEGRRRSVTKLTINQDHGSAVSDAGDRIEIPVGTHDYLSFFYAVRTFNLTPPRRNAVSILVNNKPKTLFITSLRKNVIQLGTEQIPAIEVSLTTDDPESDKYQLRAWISDDKRRLPLRFMAVTELGPIRADLAIIPVNRQ